MVVLYRLGWQAIAQKDQAKLIEEQSMVLELLELDAAQ
jgi:hypothetical protein